jgi:hypothetical protein
LCVLICQIAWIPTYNLQLEKYEDRVNRQATYIHTAKPTNISTVDGWFSIYPSNTQWFSSGYSMKSQIEENISYFISVGVTRIKFRILACNKGYFFNKWLCELYIPNIQYLQLSLERILNCLLDLERSVHVIQFVGIPLYI